MVNKVAKVGFTVAAMIYVIFHFLTLILEAEWLIGILSVSGLFALLFALLHLGRKAAILPLFLIALVIAISIFDPKTRLFHVFWEGATAMRALISMLLVIPIVGWVLRQENYVEDTIILLKKRLKNSKMLYFVLMLLTQLISFFLLFGSIAVVYQIIQAFFSKQDSDAWKKFKATSILRGFSLSTIWVISIPSFAFSVEVMNASLIPSFIQGFILALAGVLLSLVFLYIYEKRQRISFSADITEAISNAMRNFEQTERRYRNPIEFLLLFISLLVLTLLVNALVPLGLLTIIPIVVVCWALVYFIVKRKVRVLGTEARTYLQEGLIERARECSLLLAAGLLIAALNTSGLSLVVMEGIYSWTESVLGLNFLWILPFIVMLLGFLGVGPLTVMVLIAGIVKSIHLPFPPELIVLAMTLGSALSILYSPLIIPVLFLSSLNGLNPIENSMKQNWKFGIGLYFLIEAYIQVRILFL